MWAFVKSNDGYAVGVFKNDGIFRSFLTVGSMIKAIQIVHYLNGGGDNADLDDIKRMLDNA